MSEWDPFGVFQPLLKNFSLFIEDAKRLHSDNAMDTLEVKIAILGFSKFYPLLQWSYDHYIFISGFLNGDYSPESLAEYGECAKPFASFAVLALGALLGKFNALQLNDRDFLIGQTALVAYMDSHLAEICSTKM